MHHAFGMGRSQCIGDFPAMEQGPFYRERAALQLLRQRFAFQQLHHQIVGADVVKGTDVAMIQGGDRASFSLESLAEFLTAGFDRDFSRQTSIGGPVDFSHPSRADLPFDLVRPQLHSSLHYRASLKKTCTALPGRMFQRRSILREDCFRRGTQFRVGIFQRHVALGGSQFFNRMVKFSSWRQRSGVIQSYLMLLVSHTLKAALHESSRKQLAYYRVRPCEAGFGVHRRRLNGEPAHAVGSRFAMSGSFVSTAMSIGLAAHGQNLPDALGYGHPNSASSLPALAPLTIPKRPSGRSLPSPSRQPDESRP